MNIFSILNLIFQDLTYIIVTGVWGCWIFQYFGNHKVRAARVSEDGVFWGYHVYQVLNILVLPKHKGSGENKSNTSRGFDSWLILNFSEAESQIQNRI